MKTILEQMALNRPNAEMDVTLGTPSTYGGRVGLKRAATETLKTLRIQYRNKLMESTVFIVVAGPDRTQFSEIAAAPDFGCFTADPEEFYKNLVSRIDPTLFTRENVRNLFSIASNVLEDKMLELDVNSYGAVSFSDKYNSGVKSAEEFVPLIARAINDQVGAEIVGVNAIHAIVDAAIAKNHLAAITPLILNVGDEKLALDLYKSLPELVPKGALSPAQHAAKKKAKAFLVVTGKASKTLTSTEGAILVKKVSDESVGEALTAIRNKVL